MFIEGVPTDRSFHDIDARFSGSISRAIQTKLLEQKGSSQIRVCDIACGPSAWAIQKIVKQYSGGILGRSKIFGIGIDYQLETPKTTRNLLLKRGDLFELSGDTEIARTVDVAYSAYIIGKLAQYKEQYLRLLSLAVSQVSQSLARGGIAFMDEGIYSMNDPYIPLSILRHSLEEVHPGYDKEFRLGNAGDIQTYSHFLVIERLH